MMRWINVIRTEAAGSQAPPATPPYHIADEKSAEKIELPANDNKSRRWSTADGRYWLAAPTADRLEPGLYRPEVSQEIGYFLNQMRCDTDDLIDLPDSVTSEVLAEIKKFWTLKDTFKKHGFLHKRGVMMWGPPGSGKTAGVQLLIQNVIKDHDGIAIFIDHPEVASRCLQLVRRIEPERPIIALMEDLDALIERFKESEYLALLDGESQVDNIVFVSTTNYPEYLDRRFVDRPSRFDIIKKVDMPSAAARKGYLLAKEPSLIAEIDDWVSLSDGLSIAHLREMIILCKCFGYSLQSAAARLTEMRTELPHSRYADDSGNGGIGFRRERDRRREQQ